MGPHKHAALAAEKHGNPLPVKGLKTVLRFELK